MNQEFNKPTKQEVESELTRIKKIMSRKKSIKKFFNSIIIIFSLSIILSSLYLPVFLVNSDNMLPTLNDNDLLMAIKNKTFEKGDIVAFNSGSSLLVKRVIATEGQVVEVKDDGRVYVDKKELSESYIIDEETAIKSTVEFPLQVPANSVFVMGDNRKTSIDSRSKLVGAVSNNDVMGKVLIRLWPFDKMQFFI